ncbi:hypothetical protein JAAARDRAFT_530294 [Jaapia argillacea MUCL 33604]|uniref:DUF6699 domain-containing protein n=1 Tax=Jaapia argillacea MUCL 33604 TaxID=933084 RepID=A0A067PCB3_9AGAM|nr:hypothetical protein JAAARDRAFT_530294 [Jaapia argillacea MUCL 33604]
MSYSKTHSHSNSSSSGRVSVRSDWFSSAPSSSWSARSMRSPTNQIPPAAPGAPYIHTVPLPESPSPPTRSLSNSPPSRNVVVGPLVVHPALTSQNPLSLLFNVVEPISQIQYRRPLNPSCLDEPATNPSTTSLSIHIPQLPIWSFTVENPRGVTVSDVLNRLHAKLRGRISRTEWQGSFSKTTQNMGVAAFNARTSGDESARNDGMKRMDLLGSNTFFAGLTTPRNSDGSECFTAHFVPRP